VNQPSRLWLSVALTFALFLALIGSSTHVTQAQFQPLRIGIMGDSTTDEYRGTDNRGGSFASVTYNWLEQLVLKRDVFVGPWGNWGDPRRTGYEYNWARSAAVAQNLLTQGQAVGLASQVGAGKIDLVITWIGNNDFAPYNTSDGYEPIYNGTLSGTALDTKINDLVSYITQGVDTVRAARVVPMIVATISNWNLSPGVLGDPRFQDPAKRQRVTDAINRANQGIIAMANARGMGIFDSDAFTNSLLPRVVNGFLNVGGVQINVFGVGDNPVNGILGDGIHSGTVLGGLIANEYVHIINTLRDPDILPFSEQEILATAGLAASPNAAPAANDDSFATQMNTSLEIAYAALLANDTDANGDPLNISSYTLALYGSLSQQIAGWIYTPNPGFSGQDTFTYTVSDGRGGSDSATVRITVSPPNTPPVATNDSFSTAYETALTISNTQLLVNDNDVDNDALSITGATSPASGTLTTVTEGFSYVPNAGFSGADSFSYTISDGRGGTATATVTITVGGPLPPNTPPVANDDSFSTNEDTVLSAVIGVLFNDTDAENNPLTAALVTGPTRGSLTLNTNGTFTYTPNANANGTDSFTYTASDGSATSNTATVTITITAVNDAPVANANSYTMRRNRTLTIYYSSLLSNDSDIDGDALTVSSTGNPSRGSLTRYSNRVVYAPPFNYTGTVTFTYTISDGRGGTATATVTITVNR
jgi:VCBS repeat-containing protein